ncbi:MAG: universal stress protein [Reyranellaceae bacterium]
MRSLLLALDDTPAGASAMAFAVSLAAAHNASATGVCILDVDHLTAVEPFAIGTAYYKFKADVAHLKRAHELTDRLFEEFVRQCKARGVRSDILALEGRPSEELRRAAATHDLVVIGRDSDLHGESSSGLADTVQQLLLENPRPVLIAPATARAPVRVVVAYDGSATAARMLQLFALLGLASKLETHVISIDAAQEAADRHVAQASAYLGLYDIACGTRAIASKANPAELVIAEARGLGADLIAMGAYGRRGWREALLGSFTTRMLADSPVALFIHH